MRRLLVPVFFGLAGALAMGCSSLKPSYGVGIKNSTGVRVDDASVDWDNFRSGGGSLIPEARKWHEFIELPLPDRVTVRWRTVDGIEHRQEVDLPENLPRRFQGTLFFELLPDGKVELRVEPPR